MQLDLGEPVYFTKGPAVYSLWYILWGSLGGRLLDSLRGRLLDSLRISMWGSTWPSLREDRR